MSESSAKYNLERGLNLSLLITTQIGISARIYSVRSIVTVQLRMEAMSAKRVNATVLALAPCGCRHCAETFFMNEVGEMLDVLAVQARTAEVHVVKGTEHTSGAMVKMFAGTKRCPSRGVIHLTIGERLVWHLRGKSAWRKVSICGCVDTEREKIKTA